MARDQRPSAFGSFGADPSPPLTPSVPANYYRKHAERVRRLAADATTPVVKSHLLQAALQYERLAEKANVATRNLECGDSSAPRTRPLA
jgi:hypothetical protein